MDPVKLRHFLSVLECGNFAGAAQRVGVSQPAISKSIASLERSVGVPLFVRGRQGAQPTASADVLAGHARLILAEGQLAQAEITALSNAAAGRLAIGASVSLAQTLLPQALARFQKRWPDVVVSVDVGLSPSLFDALVAGDLDFVISAPPVVSAYDDIVRQDYLLDERDALIMGADHPLANDPAPSLSALGAFPWIMPRRSGRLRHIHAVFASAGLPPPARMLRSESTELARGLLNSAPYICLLGDTIFKAEIETGRFRALHDERFALTRAAFLTSRRRSRLRPAAGNLATILREVAAR